MITIYTRMLEAKSKITGKELVSPFKTKGPSRDLGHDASDEERAQKRKIAQNPTLGAQVKQEPIPDHIQKLAAKMRKHKEKTGEIGGRPEPAKRMRKKKATKKVIKKSKTA